MDYDIVQGLHLTRNSCCGGRNHLPQESSPGRTRTGTDARTNDQRGASRCKLEGNQHLSLVLADCGVTSSQHACSWFCAISEAPANFNTQSGGDASANADPTMGSIRYRTVRWSPGEAPHYVETPVSIWSALPPSDSVWRPMETRSSQQHIHHGLW